MTSSNDALEPTEFEYRSVGSVSERTVVRALPMTVPENLLRQGAEKKRIKKGILTDSEERRVFEKVIYLPYLDFTYRYPAEKGFFSKQSTEGQGRSVVMALREVNFGFYPELTSVTHLLVDVETEPRSVVQGVDSTILVSERLEELKVMLSNYDNRLEELTRRYYSLAKTDLAKQDIKDTIDHLKETRELRWKMFADGLRLPTKVGVEKLELLEGSLFYLPYFIARLSRARESRFLVWDREGKENESIADELTKNDRFRELIQSHAMS